MIRRVLASVSLLLAASCLVAISTSWGRSYYSADRITYSIEGLVEDTGGIRMSDEKGRPVPIPSVYLAEGKVGFMQSPSCSGVSVQRLHHWRLAGFMYFDNCIPIAKYRYRAVELPLWFPLLIFSIYPIAAFIRGPYRRYRRKNKGLCLKCGYDLQGNVSGICPECGEGTEQGS